MHEKSFYSSYFQNRYIKTAKTILIKKIVRIHDVLVYNIILYREHQTIYILKAINYFVKMSVSEWARVCVCVPKFCAHSSSKTNKVIKTKVFI